jgi:uncharacterized protein (TIGR02271 family)
MPRLDRIAALADPAERADAAAMVEAEARAEADRPAEIRAEALAAVTTRCRRERRPDSDPSTAPPIGVILVAAGRRWVGRPYHNTHGRATMDQDTRTIDYDTWTGRDAYDVNGDKIGNIKDVFFDDVTGRPEWIEVKAGIFKGTRLAPLNGACIETNTGDAEDRLRLAFDNDRVKDAPDMDTGDDHLSPAQERELYSYYGFNSDDRNDTDFGYGKGWDKQRFGRMHVPGQRGDVPGQPQTQPSPGRDDAMTRSEEELRVSKQREQTGTARLRKYVVTEQRQVTVPVEREEVRVEREPITDANRAQATSGPDISEAEHEVTLHEEQPVVSKKTVPKERVKLEKETVTDTETVTGDVRKQKIDVEGDVENTTRRTK